MFYILVDKKTNRVVNISEKGFSSYSDNLLLAEVDALPEKYDFLTAENIIEVTEKQVKERYDDNGEIVAYEEDRTYTTCDLKACFKPEPTAEQLEKLKQVKYEKLVERLIRQKYSLSNELAILRQATTKVEEFNAYNEYAEECKTVAKTEIYGG